MLTISHRLNRAELEALRAGESVRLILEPPGDKLDDLAGNPEERKLISAWNTHPFILGPGRRESRNDPLEGAELAKHRTTIRRAIDRFGLVELCRWMNGYFEACEQGKHRNGKKNSAYKHLGTFCEAMLKEKTNRPSFFGPTKTGIEDLHKADTIAVADAYARRFLGRKVFGLKNPSDEYQHFQRAAGWIRNLRDRGGKWSSSTILRALLSVVEDLSAETESPVTPGWMDSEKIWKNHLPQRLKGRN